MRRYHGNSQSTIQYGSSNFRLNATSLSIVIMPKDVTDTIFRPLCFSSHPIEGPGASPLHDTAVLAVQLLVVILVVADLGTYSALTVTGIVVPVYIHEARQCILRFVQWYLCEFLRRVLVFTAVGRVAVARCIVSMHAKFAAVVGV